MEQPGNDKGSHLLRDVAAEVLGDALNSDIDRIEELTLEATATVPGVALSLLIKGPAPAALAAIFLVVLATISVSLVLLPSIA
jgi:hypothetical protein